MASPVKQASSTQIPPPEKYRWKPGVSGNPSGRKRGATLAESLRHIGTKAAPEKVVREIQKYYPEIESISLREAILLGLQIAAARGSMKAIEILFDRLEGRPPVSEPEGSDNRGMILTWIDSLK